MSFFRYFMLRVPQLMLILSVSLPLAAVFSVQVSAAGPVDGGSFYLHGTVLTAFLWAALALYTRETDRVRHLTSSPVVFVRCDSSFTGMRQHEKAELIWQILQDDSLYRKQILLWWRGLRNCLRIVILHGPVVMLPGAALFCWLAPEETASVVRDWHTLSAEKQVQIVGSLLVVGYFITALIWVVNYAAQIREGDGFCFRAAWLESVRRFALQQQEPKSAARAVESDTDLENIK
ncbi:hypothetical protein [Citrobacter freundii]|uniref:hypothetical protein n=1 Tax=Citrobacter freundii TaxID=546 RepID=UPI000FD7DF92|nr:hypothetical protein [Citrobacter freundii]RVS02805.1 hypothetical protein EOL22_17205 [Citrobacter freundii]